MQRRRLALKLASRTARRSRWHLDRRCGTDPRHWRRRAHRRGRRPSPSPAPPADRRWLTSTSYRHPRSSTRHLSGWRRTPPPSLSDRWRRTKWRCADRRTCRPTYRRHPLFETRGFRRAMTEMHSVSGNRPSRSFRLHARALPRQRQSRCRTRHRSRRNMWSRQWRRSNRAS